MFQNYVINKIVNHSNIYLNNFLSVIFKEFSTQIYSLTNLNNKDNPDCILIRTHLESCFKRKVKTFSLDNNITDITITEESQMFDECPPAFIQDKYPPDEHLVKPLKKSNSLIYITNEKEDYKEIIKTNLNDKWFILKNNKWKFLNEELKQKIKIFLEGIIYQETILDNKNCDVSFSFIQNEIKNDLINFINENIGKYFNKILSNYDNSNYINNFENNEIKSIIKNEDIESFFKKQIIDSLTEFNQKEKLTKLKYISTIVTGKSGVGKSTLINCLLKDNLAEEGVGDVTTLQTRPYKGKNMTFLNIIDTRGYELNQKFNPEKIKEEVLKIIKNQKKEKNFNDYIQCIWYCVNTSKIDKSEIDALTKLKNNSSNIPLIVVFTNSNMKNDVENVKKQINTLFPDMKFISVLGRRTQDIQSFGLDDLLNMTLNTIKSLERNDIFNEVKKDYKKEEGEILKKNVSNIQVNIINKLVEKFITNYNNILSETDFEQYLYGLFEKVINEFSGRNEITQKTKSLIQYNNIKIQIKNRIQSYILFYSKTTKNFIDLILESKSLEYLDMQVKIEKLKNMPILDDNKKNRENFKEIISKFLQDNFYYVAQKYLIFRFIKDIIVVLSEKLGESIIQEMEQFLLSKEIESCYKKIYLSIFSEFEEEIGKFKDQNGKIY